MPRREAERVAGYILAGGASRRMGQDKALLTANGESLLARVERIVREVAGDCTIVAPEGRYEELGVPVLGDRWPGEGPLGGILTAIETGDADWSIITAVDLPSLGAEYLAELLAAARSAGRTAVPIHSDGGLEPLCGVYCRADGPALRRFFDAGGRRVKDALREIQPVTIPANEAHLRNVNTPEDWQVWRP